MRSGPIPLPESGSPLRSSRSFRRAACAANGGQGVLGGWQECRPPSAASRHLPPSGGGVRVEGNWGRAMRYSSSETLLNVAQYHKPPSQQVRRAHHRPRRACRAARPAADIPPRSRAWPPRKTDREILCISDQQTHAPTDSKPPASEQGKQEGSEPGAARPAKPPRARGGAGVGFAGRAAPGSDPSCFP